jgi:hypothetical protein
MPRVLLSRFPIDEQGRNRAVAFGLRLPVEAAVFPGSGNEFDVVARCRQG